MLRLGLFLNNIYFSFNFKFQINYNQLKLTYNKMNPLKTIDFHKILDLRKLQKQYRTFPNSFHLASPVLKTYITHDTVNKSKELAWV